MYRVIHYQHWDVWYRAEVTEFLDVRFINSVTDQVKYVIHSDYAQEDEGSKEKLEKNVVRLKVAAQDDEVRIGLGVVLPTYSDPEEQEPNQGCLRRYFSLLWLDLIHLICYKGWPPSHYWLFLVLQWDFARFFPIHQDDVNRALFEDPVENCRCLKRHCNQEDYRESVIARLFCLGAWQEQVSVIRHLVHDEPVSVYEK